MDKKEKENQTKYGEVIPSMYNWLPIDKQKEKAKKLANITNKNNEKNIKK